MVDLYFARGMKYRAPFILLLVLFFTSPISFAQEYDDELLKIIGGTHEHSFRVEVVDTPEKRATGLMHREVMPIDAGMLFCFDQTQPVFMWMKNTILSLDMIFIREDGTIAKITENTVPFSEAIISSEEDVRFVLELNAGAVSTFGIKSENRVVHSTILSCTS
ncbi:DUF192 domain-containing protein [Lentilitoribacter sp. EG35]|jgi:uncharacterized membrane protein (UPF0127 family)|uniref:DUF192 domain-containing protein n=1 Tax=Lentilitoribacter sp. EG35 TaxID=3234192 RepID=UPI0034615B14